MYLLHSSLLDGNLPKSRWVREECTDSWSFTGHMCTSLRDWKVKRGIWWSLSIRFLAGGKRCPLETDSKRELDFGTWISEGEV